MKRIFLFLFFVGLFIYQPADGLSVKKLSKNSISLSGSINQGDFKKFDRVFNSKIRTVYVRSGGGLVDDAVQIGLKLQKQGVEVVVFGRCVSSCANYFFLAGRKRKLTGEGHVAFHGSPYFGLLDKISRKSINEYIDKSTLTSEFKKFLSHLSRKEIRNFRGHKTRTVYLNERKFFSNLKFNRRLILASLSGNFSHMLDECRKVNVYPELPEPFLYPTVNQLRKYGVKAVGTQNWDEVSFYETAAATMTHIRIKRRTGRTVFVPKYNFCIDATGKRDLDRAIAGTKHGANGRKK